MKKMTLFTLTLLVLSIISLQTAFAQVTLEGHKDDVNSVSFSPDGTTLASGSSDGKVKLWDVATGTNIATLHGHWTPVESVSFSPDGKTLASASLYFSFFDANLDDGTVELWDVATKQNIATLQVIATICRVFVCRVFAGWKNPRFWDTGWHGGVVGRGNKTKYRYTSRAYVLGQFCGIFTRWKNPRFRSPG